MRASNVANLDPNTGSVGPHMPGNAGPDFWAEQVQAQDTNIFSRLRRRKMWFLTTTLLTASAVGATYIITPKTYRAAGDVLIVATSGDSMVAPQNAQAMEKLGDQADMESQIILLRSPSLLHSIIEKDPTIVDALMRECQENSNAVMTKLKSYVRDVKPCNEVLGDEDSQVAWMSNSFDVSAAGRSRVIAVSYTSTDPAVAKLMVNTLIDAYVAQGTADKLRTRSQAAVWIHSELERLASELREDEQRIEQYRRQHGLIKGQTGSIQSESLSSISQQLAVAQAQRSQALAALQQVGKGSSTMRDVTASATITGYRAQQSAAAARLAQLSAQVGPKNPAYIAAANELNNINGQIGAEINRVQAGLKQSYDAADQQVKDLQRQMSVLEGEVGTASDAESAMATMSRDVEVKRDLYVDLSKKSAALETERRLVSGDARVVSHADKPVLPWFPKLMPFVAGGGILALMMGIAAAVLRDKADKTVRATVNLEFATSLPVLGHIPAAGRFKQPRFSRSGKIPVTVHPQLDKPSALQESIRSLYAQCILMSGTELKTVMVSSSNPGEGKTFLTLALAQFAAQAGKRVLAIEADLRRPTFAFRFKLAGKVGLVDILRGHADVEEAIQQSKIPNLHFITAGRPAIDSTELLNSDRMKGLMPKIAGQYDLIFLDSPPSQVLVDARILAPMVDGILYCAKWGETENNSVAMGVKALQTAGGNILGMVLGQVKAGEYKLYETRQGHHGGPYLLHGNT